MRVPSMMDIKHDATRRTVLVVFLLPAFVISAGIVVVGAIIELVKELPDTIRTVWRG